MTPQELQQNLRQFTGTDGYHKWSALFHNFVLTDGTKYLAEEAGAYWLMDMIASHYSSYKNEGFVVAFLTKFPRGGARLSITGGDYNILEQQDIEYTDFPLEEITLYVIPQEMENGGVWCILLPSEY